MHEHTVGKWRRRFAEMRVESLSNEYRSGRPRNVTDDKVAEVVERTLTTMPKNEKPKPYKWFKSADEILAYVRRFCLKANALGRSEEDRYELKIRETSAK